MNANIKLAPKQALTLLDEIRRVTGKEKNLDKDFPQIYRLVDELDDLEPIFKAFVDKQETAAKAIRERAKENLVKRGKNGDESTKG